LAIDAASTDPTLSDIRHVVILMQENRSFDHYFGTLSGVRGFSDPGIVHNVIDGAPRPVWEQFGYAPIVGRDPNGWLVPFHLQQRPPFDDGDTTNDIDHSWGTQHVSWNGGKMDAFVTAHLAADGVDNFAATMGYFQRSDLAFYYALADAFTICDAYHCSVLGPTDPNRVMALSGTIDPAGEAGGPVLVTQTDERPESYGTLDWTTMPEQLLSAGVTWKVYNDPTGLALFNPLPYFKAYSEPTTAQGAQLIANALTPNFPANFAADVAAGTLPQVSWIHGPAVQCEHPATAPQWGENLVQTVLDTLTSNPEVWAHTLFILNYDENGGFFDHMPPPVPPAGTAGEYLTMSPLPSAASGIAGPVGLGFRVPCILVSPFTQGGYRATQVFDHTSTLRLIETLFGVEVPNLSPWRRSVTGDMTSALALGRPAATTVPSLPAAPPVDPTVDEQIILNAISGTFDYGIPYPPPLKNTMPAQETTPSRPTPPQ
jgi:phospholipase C